MARKKIEEKKIIDVNKLINIICNTVGLKILPNGVFVDEDTNCILSFNDVLLIHPEYNPGRSNYKYFDPIFDRKLIQNLFAYNERKNIAIYGESYETIITYFTDKDELGRNGLELKTQANEKYTSRKYFNDNMKYLDLIIKVNGMDIDLTEFDMKIESSMIKKDSRK